MNARRWLLPSLTQGIWIAFFLGITLTDWRLVLINADGEPCLHWRIGRWMIEHRAVIHTDAFSHTRAGAPFITKEWLGEVLFAAAGDTLGWNGIVLLSAGLIATCLWLLHRQLLAEGNDLLLSTALTLVAAMSCSVHWLARPHLFTHLFAVVFAWQLRLFDRGKLPTRQLFARLVPLMALWVNLHGAFFTGFVIIATFFMGRVVLLAKSPQAERPAVRSKLSDLTVLAVACALATLVNPNGWRLSAHVVEFLRDPILSRYTNEFRSPNFHTSGIQGCLIALALLALTLIIVRPVPTATDVVIIGTWGLLALLSSRNVPIFALLITPILAGYWQTALTSAKSGRLIEFYRRVSANVTSLDRSADGRVTMALAFVVLLAVAAKPQVLGGPPVVETGMLTNRFPVAAVRFVADNPRAVNGEMFNDYGWGGYLMLSLPDHAVFVDGRNDFYGPELVKEFDDVNKVRPGWDAILQKYDVGWTILPRGHGLNMLLALRKDWSLAYTDEVAAIYTRYPKRAAVSE
jgi:hypothetical protein